MKTQRNGFGQRILPILLTFALVSIPAAHAYTSISIEYADWGAVTWFYFDETGYITDNNNSCGTDPYSQCFSVQLNTDTAAGNQANFDQAALEVYPTISYWQVWLGCPVSGACYVNQEPSSSYEFDTSDLNSTSNVIVLGINAGDSGQSYSITSCNYEFTQPSYSFEFFILNTSTCTSSDAWTDQVGSGTEKFTDTAWTYMQSVDVGIFNDADATFHHTQETGELFDDNEYTYTGDSGSLTGETSNMNFHDGTLGSVVPLCYYSPDQSAPC